MAEMPSLGRRTASALGKNCYLADMATSQLSSRLLASGTGWSVSDFVCGAGPHDPAFQEQHETACIAAVTEGSFQYRSTHGAALLVPGAVLLGNPGYCFECGHEHGTGDRCLAFNFTPDSLEAIAADVPGARRTWFSVPRLPPLPSLAPLLADAEAARDDGDRTELEELALRLAGGVTSMLANTDRCAPSPSTRDQRRLTDALRRIEAQACEPLALADLAREASMSRYHFLRTFRRLVGMTPHQYVLRTRLHRAAVRLRRSTEAISAIAFDVGFNDLSTFNRRFRRVMGVSPSDYRLRRG
jgi:AraC-like DNA-binding protein